MMHGVWQGQGNHAAASMGGFAAAAPDVNCPFAPPLVCLCACFPYLKHSMHGAISPHIF